jgi:hypothetical protein
MRISVDKIYKIDKAGNANVERSWIMYNPNNEDIDLTDYEFYVIESVNTLGSVKAFDSKGDIVFSQEDMGDDIEIVVKPRIMKLGSLQEYKITLQYHFPSIVHKLGDIWFFSDTIYGIEPQPNTHISKRMDAKIQVFLPNLKKTFLQTSYHESNPIAIDHSEKENPIFKDNTALEWNCSLSPRQRYQFKLFYGIKTRAKLTAFITAVGTVIVAELVRLAFRLGGG